MTEKHFIELDCNTILVGKCSPHTGSTWKGAHLNTGTPCKLHIWDAAYTSAHAETYLREWLFWKVLYIPA